MQKMRLRKAKQEQDKTNVHIRVLRSSTCIDVIQQLPGGVHDMGNWVLGCDYCNNKMQGIPSRKKRKGTSELRDRQYYCTQPFRKKSEGGRVTINTLQYNLFCQYIQDELMDEQAKVVHPSVRSLKNTSL